MAKTESGPSYHGRLELRVTAVISCRLEFSLIHLLVCIGWQAVVCSTRVEFSFSFNTVRLWLLTVIVMEITSELSHGYWCVALYDHI